MTRALFIGFLALIAMRAGAESPPEQSPQQSVVIDLHRPWLDGANWDSNTPPIVYGVDATLDQPRFSVIDPNAFSLWVYRFALPIDLGKYPILTMKYRAKNASKDAPYVLRLVAGAGGGKTRFDAFKGSDLICDGQEHELKQDLRELNADGSLSGLGICLKTDTEPAFIDLTGLKLSAADSGVEKLKDDSLIRIHVTDQDDQPIAGVKVIVDAERANFARSAQTDGAGDASITPLANELGKHMLRIEKDGFLTIEVPNALSESGQALLVKTMKAVQYGGIAEDSEGRVAARAQISIKLKPELLEQIPTRFQTNIVTSDAGEWKSLPLPADSTQVLMSLTQREGDKPKVTDLEPAKLQLRLTREQNARNLRQIGAAIMFNAAAAGAQPASEEPHAKIAAPESAIVLDLQHPWVDGSKWERNTAPNVYGIDMTRAAPRINLLDADAKTLWALRLSDPIDAKQYPLLSFRYRAQNTGAQTAYVLRIVHGTLDNRQVVKFFKADDLKSDGDVHELVADLRDKQLADSIVEIGIGLWSDDKPAWIDVVGVTFSAAPEAPMAQKLGDDPEIKFQVSTLDGTPLAGAKVIVDAERANFARSAETDDKGEAIINPCATETHTHMARIVKAGYLQIDHAIDGTTAEFKTAPAVRYGGAARDQGGQLAANAQIVIRAKNQFLKDTGLMPYPVAVVTTDDKGNWTTPPLPSDASLLTIQCRLPASVGAEAVVSNMDVEQSQQPKEPWPTVAMTTELPQPVSTAGPSKTPATRPAVAIEKLAASTEKPAESKPAVEPVTAIVQKVDDTQLTVGWTGVEGDQLLVITHPEAGKEEHTKISLMDVTELTLKRGALSGSTSAFSLSAPTSSPSQSPSDASVKPSPTSRPASKLANCRVILANDDRLNSELLSWSDKHVNVRSSLVPDVVLDVPVGGLREVWCGSADQVKKAQAMKEPPGLDDIAFAAKDNDVVAVHGIVIGIDGDSLHFRYDNADRKIALNRLVGLVMAKPEDAPADDSVYEAIQLVSDDQLSGRITGLDAKTLSMRTRIGADVRLPIDQIAKVSTRNGRQVYLSDLKPTSVEQTPYFDRVIEYRLDKSLNGKPITLADGTYPRGVSMHARTVLTYNLDGRFDEFRSKVGFLLPEGKVGDCSIRVLGDGKPLFDKPDARGDQPPADLKLPVAGVHELKLEVDYGRNEDVGDRVAFANARLLRANR